MVHPQHPLYGHRVAVVRRRRTADDHEPDLIIRLPDGQHAAIAQSLTTPDQEGLSPSQAVPLPVTAPVPLLAPDGVRRLAHLVATYRDQAHH